MSDVWVVSAVLGWIVIGLLVAVVLVLLRHTAELRARLDALDGGDVLDEEDLWSPDPTDLIGRTVAETVVPLVGETAGTAADRQPGDGDAGAHDAADGKAEDGHADGADAARSGGVLRLAGADARPTLLVYHSPTCWSCGGLEEAMTALRAEVDGTLDVVSVLALRRDAAAAHRATSPLPGVPTVSLDDLPDLLHADSTPALRGLDADGRLTVVGRPSGLDDLRAAAERCRVG
ncbi:MAG: hypothetical protein AB7G37_00750 [Solirubrobacteraceae bacterium]